MHDITPCQRKISDRFPVASFVVNVSPNRLFEIVCTTDPQLLRPEYRGRRSAQNFFTSRSAGLLRAPAGHATYLVPAEQLKRFAGRPRIYFALASYDSPRGDDPKLSIAPSAVEQAPSIQLTADFTGRSLDRSRIRGASRDGKYGAPAAVLTWGGDVLAPRTEVKAAAQDYDDGFSPELWMSSAPATGTRAAGVTAGAVARAPDPHEPPEPDPHHENAGLGEAYGRPIRAATSPVPNRLPAGVASEPEPVGFEDALALRGAGAAYGRVAELPAVQAYGRPAIPAPPRYAPAMPAVEEPPGAEDGRDVWHGAGGTAAVQVFGAAPTYGRGAAGSAEPPGAEDARELARYGAAGAAPAPAPATPVTDPMPALPAPAAPAVATAPAADIPGRGVDDGWIEDDDESDLVSSAGEGEGQPLTIRRKFEILLPVAAYESGEARYSAVLGSVEYDDPSHAAYQRVHHGLHWGLVLVTQRSGVLGKVLTACERRDSMQFRQAFGSAQADRLIHVTTASSPDARLAPVGGEQLWTRGWMEKFRAAGRIPAFQAAQNEVAIEHYFDRNLGFAVNLGLMTDRALAMVFDRAIHMGIAGSRQWILQAVSPITGEANRAAALQALGHADVAAFQRAAGLAATGRFGTQTHAALLGAVRGLGEHAPFAVPAVADMLDKLVAAAAGRRFERRIRELRSLGTYTDAVQRVI